MPPRKRAKRTMSDDHKAALAAGRNEGRAVRAYLEALEAHRPKRGRKRTLDSIEKQLATIERQLPGADPLTRVKLIQAQMDLKSETSQMQLKTDLTDLEAQFVKAARAYSERKGISYAAWRAIGVSPATLSKAGITRSM
jgi:hypothetical protein